MNREIRNRITDNKQNTRNIEIYRKSPIESGFQSESIIKDIEEPKIINKEDKIFFLKVGLITSLVFLFMIIISSLLFSNPFGDTLKNIEAMEVTPIVDSPSVQSNEETLFFDKDSQLKIVNILLVAFGFFLVIRLFTDVFS